jgi:LmbE family N-acetylglucosaminyl deacetylase
MADAPDPACRSETSTDRSGNEAERSWPDGNDAGAWRFQVATTELRYLLSLMSVPDSYGVQTRGLPSNAFTTDIAIPKRALAIGAHPDDVEFGCGGTMAKWAANGCEIFHLVLTDGSKGTWDPDTDQAELVVTRQREQRAAARALGNTSDDHVAFLGWIDGELECGLRQRWEVAYWIRKFAPDVVLGHDPWRRYRIHPDHRNAGFLTTDGIVAARDPKFFPEQNLKPHRPTTLLLWEADEPDHVESIDDVIDTKMRALLAHESQHDTTMHFAKKVEATASFDPASVSEEILAFRSALQSRAQEAGRLANINAGEAFKRIDRL